MLHDYTAYTVLLLWCCLCINMLPDKVDLYTTTLIGASAVQTFTDIIVGKLKCGPWIFVAVMT